MSRRWAALLLIPIALLLLIFVMDSTGLRLDQLARDGEIQKDAPVKTSLEIVIHAPAEKVWSVLTDVKDWPRWQTDITATEIAGPLQTGTPFTWRAGASQIKSRIALVQPYEKFAWTGSALNARAIHVWKLQRLPGNDTLVKTDESMSGFLLSLFYSSKELTESDQRWLDRLKLAAER